MNVIIVCETLNGIVCFFFLFAFTELNSVRQTDSLSNLSDMSGNTAVQTGRPRMDVACVIDALQAENLAHRKCALDELRQACSLVNANLQQIQVRAHFVMHHANQTKIVKLFRFNSFSVCGSLRNWILAKQIFWTHFTMPTLRWST